jgi:hypothetical protein
MQTNDIATITRDFLSVFLVPASGESRVFVTKCVLLFTCYRRGPAAISGDRPVSGLRQPLLRLACGNAALLSASSPRAKLDRIEANFAPYGYAGKKP